MKSELIDPIHKARFPCLMRSTSSGVAVLFSSWGVGTVVCGRDNRGTTIGGRRVNWEMEYFRLFDGKVLLQND